MGRSGIRVVAPPVNDWNLVRRIYTLKEMGPAPVDDPFIYGYFWSRTKNVRALLGSKYRVLRDLISSLTVCFSRCGTNWLKSLKFIFII